MIPLTYSKRVNLTNISSYCSRTLRHWSFVFVTVAAKLTQTKPWNQCLVLAAIEPQCHIVAA